MKRLLVLLVLLAACDPVVEQRQIGPTRSVTRPTVEYGPGFCVTCMPGMDGKMTCGYKYSNFCPHPTTETVQAAPFERTHKSGVVDTVFLQLRGGR